MSLASGDYEVQVSHQMNDPDLINLNQDLGAIVTAMRKTTRYDIRAGEKRGITVRDGTEDDLGAFYQLALRTGERQNFSTEPLEYYRHIWRVLAPSHNLKLFLAEVSGETVSAAMMIAFGDSVTLWRSGWSGFYAGYYLNEAVQWTAIKWGKATGYCQDDFGGIGALTAGILKRGEALPDSPEYSAYLSKIGFGGEPAIFPKAALYVYSLLLHRAYKAVW